MGYALRKKFCVGFNFELQAAASDDAVVISLGPHHSLPAARRAPLAHDPTPSARRSPRRCSTSPPSSRRWRWNLNRALIVLRMRNGKTQPADDPAHAVRRHDGGAVPRRRRLPGEHQRAHRGARPSPGAPDGARHPDREHGRRRPASPCGAASRTARSASITSTPPRRRRSATRSSPPSPTRSSTTARPTSAAPWRCRSDAGSPSTPARWAASTPTPSRRSAPSSPRPPHRRRAARPAARHRAAARPAPTGNRCSTSSPPWARRSDPASRFRDPTAMATTGESGTQPNRPHPHTGTPSRTPT